MKELGTVMDKLAEYNSCGGLYKAKLSLNSNSDATLVPFRDGLTCICKMDHPDVLVLKLAAGGA
jgi:hypothetical protein